MAGVTFYNLKLLCYIDDTDFTDYQGIGSDPMYKRYDSVIGVIKKHIDPKFQGLLARPFYEDGVISWYVNDWNENPVCYNQLSGPEKEKYTQIKEETFSHYKQQMKKMSPEEYAILSCALKYVFDDFIYCYDNHIVLVAWGMRPDSSKHEVAGSWIKGLKNDERFKVEFKCPNHAKFKTPIGKIIFRNKGYRLSPKDIPEIIIDEGYEFENWTPTPVNYEIVSDVSFEARIKKHSITESSDTHCLTVTFESSSEGNLLNNKEITVPFGYILKASDIPSVKPQDGFKFVRWTPSIEIPITQNCVFRAEYETDKFTYNFNPGDNGIIVGENSIKRSNGTKIIDRDLPQIEAKKGYKFIGWNTSPIGFIRGNRTFTAQYEKIIPWYKRLWIWFTNKGCLNLLLWLIIFLLIALLLNWFFRGCNSEAGLIGGSHPENSQIDDSEISTIDKIKNEDGVARDNNGVVKDIVDDNGNLPPGTVVAPITGEDGNPPSIIHNDGIPDVIANRLNIYFDSEDADLEKWVHDFKEVYPEEDYSVIGVDKNVKMIQIQIPEDQRDIIRRELKTKIPDQEFFVVDESIISLHGKVSSTQNVENIGWHIKATNLENAWGITQGDTGIVIAIVDDGIDAGHPIFEGRFYKAYNVFTQNCSLSTGSGHGTHVAGLAAGSNKYLSEGVSGVATKSKIMPVQVFDNNICTFSSIASGIMYAIHNGADVVNISIGPSFQGLDQLPIADQQTISKSYFKNEERVYRHIIDIANKKNVTLVFAAGNDNILTSILPECRNINKTLNVSAVSPEFKAAKFTNYADGTNISAPGVDIKSSFPTNSYKVLEGTSMAAPIITGTVALMKSLDKELTIEEIINILNKSGKQIDNFIPKMVQIDRALNFVQNEDYSSLPNVDSNHDENENNSNEDNGDDYSKLRDELEQLKAQRDSITKKINRIENKLK